MSEKEIAERVRKVFYPYLATRWSKHPNLWELISRSWQPTIQGLMPLGGHSERNRITLFTNGDDAFTAKWDAIKNAKKRVWWSTYTIEPDSVGKRTIEYMAEAKRRGCDVVLMFDSIGSRGVTESFIKPLQALGAQCLEFGPVRVAQWRSWRYGPFRNHQKLLLVDDHGYCGGMNISEDYVGPKLHGTGRFVDTHIKIEGPAVQDLQTVFFNSLLANKEHIKQSEMDRMEERIKAFVGPTEDFEDGVFVQVLQSNIRRQRKDVQKALSRALRSATSTCYLSSPYFLPPRPVKRAIIRAAKNGVDVRIITAGDSDVPFIRAAQQHIYSSFLKRGIKIYEIWKRRLHAKMASIDGIYSYVGSFNLDSWSSHNLEANVTVLDPSLATQIENRFEYLIDQSAKEVRLEDIEKRSLFQRYYSWLAYQFFTITGPPKMSEDDEEDDDDDDDE